MSKQKEATPLPKISEEEMAKSAKARRESSNRFGLLFREMQLETFQRMLEREGDDSDLLEPIGLDSMDAGPLIH